MLGSRTQGALEEEKAGAPAARASVLALRILSSLARATARFDARARNRALRIFARARNRALRLRLGTALLLACSASGCSAVSALVECRRAERALQSAGALVVTPKTAYQLTLGRAYLDKAREEASEAQYAAAIDLAHAARRAADTAQLTQLRGIEGSK